jgi:hypothetical protein
MLTKPAQHLSATTQFECAQDPLACGVEFAMRGVGRAGARAAGRDGLHDRSLAPGHGRVKGIVMPPIFPKHSTLRVIQQSRQCGQEGAKVRHFKAAYVMRQLRPLGQEEVIVLPGKTA